jgi:hypothetical protein
MKTVKELLSEGKPSFSTSPNPSGRKDKSVVKAPPTLLFRRTAIRTFPDNHIVALYYSAQLDKYVSIPFGPEGKALTIELSETEQLDEWLAPALAVARAVGARALPAIGRGAGAAVRGAGNLTRGAIAKAKSLLSRKPVGPNDLAPGANLGQKGLARQSMRKRWMRRLGYAGGIGAAADAVVDNVLGQKKDNDFQKNNQADHQFDADLGKRAVSLPQSVLAGQSPVTNYRQKQNQNYIWNTQPRAGQVQESLNRIIETKKTEVISGIKVTPTVAKKLVNLYESLNIENKQNFEKMINENADSLRKVINFSLRK